MLQQIMADFVYFLFLQQPVNPMEQNANHWEIPLLFVFVSQNEYLHNRLTNVLDKIELPMDHEQIVIVNHYHRSITMLQYLVIITRK
jgi:hypothetical protein